jgi:predicted DNA-binding transcriptional regulator AlpA
MDGQPVSFDDVSKVGHGRSYMSNRSFNQSGAPASSVAMRAIAPVFSTEDRTHENRVGGISEHPIYPSYPASFKSYVPTVERTLHQIESTALSQSIAVPGNDRLMNARQVAARLGVSQRWVRDHTTRRSPRIRGLKLGSLVRYRWADVEAFLAELDTQRSSRPSRFRV